MDSACGGNHYEDKSLSVVPEIPNTVTVMRGLFYELTSIKTIKIPASVKSFGTNPGDTFRGCKATIYVEKGSTLTQEDFTKAGATECTIIFEK